MNQAFQIDVSANAPMPVELSNTSEAERLMAFLNDYDVFGMYSESGIAVTESVSLSHIPFWAAVTRLSGDLAQMESELKLPTGPETTETVTDSQAVKVMRNPNALMTELVFRETMYKDMFCWGNGLAEILRDAAGRPVQMTPLYPQHTWLDWDEDNFMWYVTTVQIGNEWRTYKIPPGDVYHLKWLTLNGLWGYTVISLLRNSLGWGLALTKHANRLFSNSARPDGILTTDAALRDETLAKIRQSWNDYHQGLDNVGRTALLHSGLKYQPMSMSSRDAEFIASKKLDREDWATAFGMPSHFLNAADRAPFASEESTYRHYLNHTLGRHMTMENQESKDKLLTRREKRRDMYFEHDVSRFLQANIESRATATSQAVGGPWMTREEARTRWWNLNPEPAKGQTFLERSTGAPIGEQGEGSGRSGEDTGITRQRTGASEDRDVENKVVSQKEVQSFVEALHKSGVAPTAWETMICLAFDVPRAQARHMVAVIGPPETWSEESYSNNRVGVMEHAYARSGNGDAWNHKPGGKDHDQKSHGRRGGSSKEKTDSDKAGGDDTDEFGRTREERHSDAVYFWSNEGHDFLQSREQAGDWDDEDLKDWHDFLDSRPPYKGRIFRGIQATQNDLQKSGLLDELNIIGFEVTNSFSKSPGIALDFATRRKPEEFVSAVFVLDATNNAVDISDLVSEVSPEFTQEKEVVTRHGTDYQIRRVSSGSDAIKRFEELASYEEKVDVIIEIAELDELDEDF